MQKEIELYWENYILGTLSYVGGKYIFKLDQKSCDEAEKNDGCPTELLLGIDKASTRLHPIFEEFEICSSRKDLKEKLHIEKEDTRFDILYKCALAYNDFQRDGFWIKAKKVSIKLWIDDIRLVPDGYIWCKSVNQAKRVILEAEKNNVSIELLDLDHDAGDYAVDGGDYIKLLDWMAETNRKYPIKLHTANPVGRDNMLRLINRYLK